MLTVVTELPARKHKLREERMFLCNCDCGGKRILGSTNIFRKKVSPNLSCGCFGKRKLFKTKNTEYYRRLYNVWHKMKYRCEVPTSSDWHKYGERGIKVSERWQDFGVFYDDMIDTYQAGLTIERVDVNGNYCKENCIWITNEDQAKNRRTTVWVDGLCAKDYCKKHNIKYHSFLEKKNKHKMSIEDIKRSFS